MKQKLDYLNQHSRPVTRRDFISRGLYGACGAVMAPTLLGSLFSSPEAFADRQATPPPKFITFDLAGGAALFANFLVGGPGGADDLLGSYSDLGWNPKAASALDRRFGLPMAGGGVSKILAGILQTASADAQAGFRMGSLLHVGNIDTSDNPLSILSLVAASQISVGLSVSGSTALEETVSGGRSKPLVDLATQRPFFVKDMPTLINAVGLGGALTDMSDRQKSRIAQLLSRLSNTQLKTLLGGPLSQAGFDYVTGGLKSVTQHVSPDASLDPRKDPNFSQIYGISSTSGDADPEVLRAALAMATLKGATGPCVITIEGCDYHDGTQTTGDNKDLEIGQEIGRVVEAAKRLKTPLVIHIITDGGIYPQSGTRIWSGDNTEKCMSVVGVYNPAGAPASYKGRLQIGAYTQSQGADRSTLIGASPALAANVAFANYLSVAGKMDQVSTLYPASLSEMALEPTLLFGALS